MAVHVLHPCAGHFEGPCSASCSRKALDRLLRRLYNMQGRNAFFFVLCQHNCNDLACLLSTPVMGMRFSWASLSAARMPVLSILEFRYECHSAEASRYFCLHRVRNSLPSGCDARLCLPYVGGGCWWEQKRGPLPPPASSFPVPTSALP